jgi:HAD superfamily phosphatase (TIGR01668 family)
VDEIRRRDASSVYQSQQPADLCIASLFDLDFTVLSDRGVRGILLDVDNTLVVPRAKQIPAPLIDHLLSEYARAGIRRWALASNSHRDLSALADAIDADIVRARLLSAKPRTSYFRRALALLGMQAHEVAMIGDKILHDIVPASKLGMHTVLVRPFARDQVVDRLLLRRRRERIMCVQVSWAEAPPA